MQEEISRQRTIQTPKVKKQSARLKTGKFQTEIKSLTPWSKILSIRFHNVPANKKMNSQSFKYFLFQSHIKAAHHKKDNTIISHRFTPIPQEIQVLNTGSNKTNSFQIHKL